jgi:multisubunit Na+/H+ antiporter MnhB subunit|tara:strand:- start:7870 stop:8052 length:183 start_codon:yes stop_codon:yes gene_type:complete
MMNIISWIKDRFTERTSLDGAMLIGVGVIGLFFSAIIPMNIICWAAIAYGAFTLYKSEDK